MSSLASLYPPYDMVQGTFSSSIYLLEEPVAQASSCSLASLISSTPLGTSGSSCGSLAYSAATMVVIQARVLADLQGAVRVDRCLFSVHLSRIRPGSSIKEGERGEDRTYEKVFPKKNISNAPTKRHLKIKKGKFLPGCEIPNQKSFENLAIAQKLQRAKIKRTRE
uniref:Uncharacterized protein n=1 Tax=Cannabis sativa TaxID=3483 RepID=A0A803PC86_CANSA